MNATFAIPTNGKVNGQDVVYKYSGDDDMWLYIDGILVLDLGGIHEPVHGTINFTTGEVVTWPQNDPNNKTLTTLEAIFSKHGITWKNDTDHSLDMFYLERGGQYSNLQMTLNIPITKTVSVKKEVDGELSDEYLNKEFSFIAYVDKGNGDMVPYNGMIEIGKTTAHITDGKFKIKPTEVAKLLDMKSSWKYKIVETGMNGNEFSSVVIHDNGTITHPLHEGEVNQSAESSVHEVELKNEVRVTNVLREEFGDIQVGKKWKGDDENNRPSSVKFQIYRIKNGDEEHKELYKSSDGKTVFELNTESWNKVFTHLLRRSGTDVYTYIVQEVSVPEGYVDTYTSEDAQHHGMNLFITNTKYGSITYEKKWEKADGTSLNDHPDQVKVQLYQYMMKGQKTTIENPVDPKKVQFKTTYRAISEGIGSNYASARKLEGDYSLTQYVQKNGTIRFTVHSHIQSFGLYNIKTTSGTLAKISSTTSEYYRYNDDGWKGIVYEATYELRNVSVDATVTLDMIGTLNPENTPTSLNNVMDIRNILITNPANGGTTDVYNVPTPPSTMPEEGTEGLVKYGDEKVLNDQNNWKDKIENLPLQTTIDGEPYYYFYYVKEVDAPAGFTVSYEGNNGTGQSIIIKNIKDYFPMSFKKVDSTNNAKVLEGAVFSLYKDEDCEQIVEFYKDENMQQATTSFTTDSNGTFTAYGLKAGTYYLKEVSAPSGYYLIDHPLKVTMDLQGKITVDEKDKDTIRVLIENSNATDIIEVKDSPVYYLPNSGGIGTHIFTMLGTAFIALAVTLYIVKRRDEEVKAS
jgi:fibro-slime domain-containing protein/LPXTG-motif cell wall-anchored protein